MSKIEAIFQGGVFKPLGQVPLKDNQRVSLSIHPSESSDPHAWLDDVRQFQRQLLERRGIYPDSTLDIAADRARDE